MVLYGAAVPPRGLEDPWALGEFCSPVLASLEFRQPVKVKTGQTSAWMVSAESQRLVSRQVRTAIYRAFDVDETSADDEVHEHDVADSSEADRSRPPCEERLGAAGDDMEENFGEDAFEAKRSRSPRGQCPGKTSAETPISFVDAEAPMCSSERDGTPADTRSQFQKAEHASPEFERRSHSRERSCKITSNPLRSEVSHTSIGLAVADGALVEVSSGQGGNPMQRRSGIPSP